MGYAEVIQSVMPILAFHNVAWPTAGDADKKPITNVFEPKRNAILIRLNAGSWEVLCFSSAPRMDVEKAKDFVFFLNMSQGRHPGTTFDRRMLPCLET